MAAGALIIGNIADTFGRKPATLIATFGMSFSLIGLSTSTNLTEFTMWYFLQAVCANACINTQVLLMSEIVTNEQRAIPGILVMTMFGVACGVYAGFGSLYPKWYELIRFVGCLSLGVAVVISWFMPRSVKWLALNMNGSELERQNNEYLNRFRGKIEKRVENDVKNNNENNDEINNPEIVDLTSGFEKHSDLKTQSDDKSLKYLIRSKMLISRVFMASGSRKLVGLTPIVTP